MDWRPWIEQHLPFTELMRGGATVWPKGGKALIGDSLGPVMHIHDGASEIFYFVAGRCRLEVGDSEEFFEPGDFVLVPPEVPHNLWNAGDEDLLVFWLVAPNFVNNKWRTENFPVGAMSRRAIRSRVQPDAALPGDNQIHSQILTLTPATFRNGRTGDRQEAILYVTEGAAQVQIGKLGGTLAMHEFVHVPVGTDYSVANAGQNATVLIFEMPGA